MKPITDVRGHRRLQAADACPDCTPIAEMRRYLSTPYLGDEEDDRDLPRVLTPEGERASLVTALYRTDDPEAAAAALRDLWPLRGPDHVMSVPTEAGEWVQANLWRVDDTIHLEATSYRAYQRADFELEILWPPVWRGMQCSSGLMQPWLSFDSSERPASWPGSPARVALEERIKETERQWVQRPTPLLGGRTPREVAVTPAGRSQVRCALVEAQRKIPAEVGDVGAFDVDRVLGLVSMHAD